MNISLEEAQRFLNQMGYECREIDNLVDETRGTGISTSQLLEKAFLSAQRWEAFIRSARLRMLGSAGFKAPLGGPGGIRGYRHMGMEFWTHYDDAFQIDNSHEISMLEAYADAMITNISDARLQGAPAKVA